MARATLGLACMLGLVRGMHAQESGSPEGHREAMQRLAFLVGTWAGDGVLTNRAGRREIWQSEQVRYELDGTILIVEGRARERRGREVGNEIFGAFAIISWDEESGYRMRSYIGGGGGGERSLTVTERGFVWTGGYAGGPVRFTMVLTERGEWHESGVLTLPDGSETTVIEFRLLRTPEGNGGS